MIADNSFQGTSKKNRFHGDSQRSIRRLSRKANGASGNPVLSIGIHGGPPKTFGKRPDKASKTTMCTKAIVGFIEDERNELRRDNGAVFVSEHARFSGEET